MGEQQPLTEIADETYLPKTIVCPRDLTDEENLAGLRTALALAEHVDAGVHVINVLRSPTPPPVRPGQRILPDLDEQWKESRAASEGKLARQIEIETDGGNRDVDVSLRVAVGVEYLEMAAYAEEVDADLIAMDSRGRHGLAQRLLGSVTEPVIRLADCPVLTVPPESVEFAPRNIVVAHRVLALLRSGAAPAVRFLRRAFGARVLLTHVLPLQSHPAAVSETGPPPIMTDEFMSHYAGGGDAGPQRQSHVPRIRGGHRGRACRIG